MSNDAILKNRKSDYYDPNHIIWH